MQHIRQLGAGLGGLNRLQLFHHRAEQQHLGKGVAILSGLAAFIALPCPGAQFFKLSEVFLRHRLSLKAFDQFQCLCGGFGPFGISQRTACQRLVHMGQITVPVHIGGIEGWLVLAGAGKPCQQGGRLLLNGGGRARSLCGDGRQSLIGKGGLDAELAHDAFSSNPKLITYALHQAGVQQLVIRKGGILLRGPCLRSAFRPGTFFLCHEFHKQRLQSGA